MPRFLHDGFELHQLPDGPADELRRARMVIMQEELEAKRAAEEAELRRHSESLPVRMNQRDADLKSGYVEPKLDDPFDKTPLGKLLAGEEVTA